MSPSVNLVRPIRPPSIQEFNWRSCGWLHGLHFSGPLPLLKGLRRPGVQIKANPSTFSLFENTICLLKLDKESANSDNKLNRHTCFYLDFILIEPQIAEVAEAHLLSVIDNELGGYCQFAGNRV